MKKEKPYIVTYRMSGEEPRKIHNVIADGYVIIDGMPMPVRYFITEDSKRIEVSTFNTVFFYGADREASIRHRAEIARLPVKE